jgi:ribosomal protein S18 acetylase RimI-like enzyme
MHRVRLAVHENRLTSTLITEEHYVPAIEETGRGRVAEDQGSIVGFAIGNVVTGNIWALFVDPDHEGRGHGRRLHDAMVRWLFLQGVRRLWLSTDPETRAQGFYEAAGWSFLGTLANGEALYELHAPNVP